MKIDSNAETRGPFIHVIKQHRGEAEVIQRRRSEFKGNAMNLSADVVGEVLQVPKQA